MTPTPDGADEQAPGDYRGLQQGITIAQAVQARLEGDPVRAFTMMRTLRAVAEAVPHVIDPSRGERTFVLVQTAISGMLAGRFPEALALLEKSLIPQIPAGLAFLNRDAHVRAAMIHALYGDPRRAASRLVAAREVPRTQSWVEAILDSDERLVVALLRPESEAGLAFEEASSSTAAQMHELWPFHVVAIGRLSVLADRRDEGRRRIEQLAAAGLVRMEGAGYSGSVIPLALGLDALYSGAVSRSQPLLAAADSRFWPTKLLLALQAVAGGAPARAIRLARSAATQTRDLAQAEELRLLVLALAHHGLGDEPAALATLRDISAPVDRFAHALLVRFSPALLVFAAAHLPGWASDLSHDAESAPVELLLTARELEVLTGLSSGASREELARSLFLSVNTVKSHQRSLYRKLGASAASEAILEGKRRGLV